MFRKLKKALELRKAKYTKRTGSPGNYKYQYGSGKKKNTSEKGLEYKKLSLEDLKATWGMRKITQADQK